MSDSANKLSLAGVLITTGIVFGDIGTSPLYVFQAITNGGKNISEPFILGGLSCVIWTLILLATFKYIFFALNADNKGEGGIFSLYARSPPDTVGQLAITSTDVPADGCSESPSKKSKLLSLAPDSTFKNLMEQPETHTTVVAS